MVRRLPWKGRLVEASRPAATESNVDQLQNSISQRQCDTHSTSNKKRVNKPDHSDDWNWRLTESEFVSTAKLFTADIHEQAYKKLLEKQKRDAERMTTVDDLLDQPLVEQAMPALPPRSTSKPQPKANIVDLRSADLQELILKTATMSRDPDKRPKTVKSGVASVLDKPAMPENFTVKSEPGNTKGGSSAVESDDGKPSEQSFPTEALFRVQMPANKPSAAALARKRKRQQAQQADDIDFVTFL